MRKLKNKGLHFHHWLIFGLLNGLIVYLSGILYPENIVLGNATVSLFAAVVLNALVITLGISFLPVVLTQLNVKKLSRNYTYLVYAVANIIIIWLLSRAALIFGLGVSSVFVALTLGIALTIGQYIYWEYLIKKIK